MTNEEMRELSGNIRDENKLVTFLYCLMRDELPVGTVEKIVDGIETTTAPCYYTNGWLAQYAQNLAHRLLKQQEVDCSD